MLVKRIASQPEVIRAIVSVDSPCVVCAVAPIAQGVGDALVGVDDRAGEVVRRVDLREDRR